MLRERDSFHRYSIHASQCMFPFPLNTSPPEAEEIFMYGMSEDEDNSDSNSDSDDTERNIVANTIQALQGEWIHRCVP